jgi:deoxyribose-phosphate aldolase
MTPGVSELAAMIDHTCLAPDATAADIGTLCAEAVEHGFHSVCVAPSRVAEAARILSGEGVRVCATVGFPHGNTVPRVKLLEAESALDLGAHEIDMVMQVGAFRDGALVIVRDEIARIADIVHARPGRMVKVILETALLSGDEIARACELAVSAGADFVKTSTGFGPAGATFENVRLMRLSVGERAGVKAAGGIRDYATAVAMVEAGASRLGTSSSVAIVGGAPSP